MKFQYFICSIPKDEQLKSQWLKVIGRRGCNVVYERVCSDHFLQKDFALNGSRRLLKTGVVPSQNLPKVRLPTELPLSKSAKISLCSELMHSTSVPESVPKRKYVEFLEHEPFGPSTSTKKIER